VRARAVALGVLALAAAVGAAAWIGLERRAAATRRIADRIEADLERSKLPADAPWRDRRTRRLVAAFYGGRDMRPAWTSGRGANDAARDLAEVLEHAEVDGLDPDDYSAADLATRLAADRKGGDARAPKALAELDLLCTVAALHYMSDVFDGRISPKSLDAVWVAQPRKGDLDSLLTVALERNRVKELLRDLPPAHEGYVGLARGRARYAEIAAAGGWKPIPGSAPLRKGDRGPRVAALRARLAATGELNGDAGGSDAFDGAVETAVKRFQQSYGRDADGVVGESELAALNVRASARLRQIELNMERWRWLPRRFGERYVWVNIPEYALYVREGAEDVLTMRVVVGKVMHQTPVFSDEMKFVVVNPTWDIPMSIVKSEIVPALKEDRDYLAANRIRVYEGPEPDAREVPAKKVPRDTTRAAELHFRQDAGELNSLGRMKFLFPNRFDVYLHDTPAGHLFSLEDRSFSHGCVRVEDPIRLASVVLRGLPEANPKTLRRMIDGGKTTTITMPKPVPVHIVYFTAFADADGRIGFRDDLYGIDAELIQKLRGRERRRDRP
jgi:murein L,D-transpeptidase YcbB/YkuD